MDAQVAYGLLSVIQDRAAAVLTRGDADSRALTRMLMAGRLIDQLGDPATVTPAGLTLDLGLFLDQLNLFDLLGEGDGRRVLGRLRAKVGDLGARLLEAEGLEGVRSVMEGLLVAVVPADGGTPPLLAMLRRQIGIGISFATTLRNLASFDLAREIPRGWTEYFFGEGGFHTVDAIALVPPAHGDLLARLAGTELTPDGVRASLQGLRGLVNERSGEQYVRDLIRITVEVAGDRRYRLRDRHRQLLGGSRDPAKASRWFKGMGSMAESLVTSAVEEVSLGVAQFQTNPIIAAAAATYAGTVARKAAQHAFLAEADL
jgi:hypothetical protein